MTQRNNSADEQLPNLTTKRFASTLPAQGLCWLSSFSLLGGGFVFAQTETSIDNIVPTVENSQPTAATNPVKKNSPAPEVAQPQPEFAERHNRLRQRLNRHRVSQSQEPVRHSKPQVEASRVTRVRLREEKPEPEVTKPRVRRTLPEKLPEITKPIVRRTLPEKLSEATKPIAPRTLPEKLPEVTKPVASRSLQEKLRELAQPEKNSNSTASGTEEKTQDYNNAYIDPTDYNNNATVKYQAPNSVVITERSSGCQATLPAGQGGSACGKTQVSRHQRVASTGVKPAPSWLRRSQNVNVANLPTIHRPAPTVNTREWRGELRGTRVASSEVTNRPFRPHRFIPHPSEFSTTKVSAVPIAPSGGTLPDPITEDNQAPRPSTVSYDFPLASTLPQIPYAGTVAYSGTGMMFPLSVPAPITSLFGWRTHPISGDRRFHAGTDLGAPMGTPVLAAARGQVQMADWMGGYGLAVIINHSSAQQTLYGHMSEVFVQPGQQVEAGTVIGRVGSTGNSTGPHLHFEVRHLTPDGWVATDPGVQLQSALSQLVQALQISQVKQEPGG